MTFPDPIPPWDLPQISFCRDLCGFHKADVPDCVLRNEFLLHSDKHKSAIPIYTDGSKTDVHVGAAMVAIDHVSVRRLPSCSSIFTAELVALFRALNYVNKHPFHSFVIYTDSRSSLEALSAPQTRNPLVLEIQHFLVLLSSHFKSVCFCWAPSHIGISGNERADQLARGACSLQVSPRLLPFMDFHPEITKIVSSCWQRSRDCVLLANKLRSIKPSVRPWVKASSRFRRWETALSRLRIGHTRLTHGFLMEGASVAPRCAACRTPLTVAHILLYCGTFSVSRRKFLPFLTSTSSLADVLSENEHFTLHSLMDFLQEVKILNQI
jgi:ribonuclease HI